MGTLDKSAGLSTQSQLSFSDLLARRQAALRDLTRYVTPHIGSQLGGCDELTRVLSPARRELYTAAQHDKKPTQSRWLQDL